MKAENETMTVMLCTRKPKKLNFLNYCRKEVPKNKIYIIFISFFLSSFFSFVYHLPTMAESPQTGHEYSVSEYSVQPTELDVEMEISRLSTSTAESIDYSLLTCIDQSQMETSKNQSQLEIKNQHSNVIESKSASELSFKTYLSRFENENSSGDSSAAEQFKVYQDWTRRNTNVTPMLMNESSILQNIGEFERKTCVFHTERMHAFCF